MKALPLLVVFKTALEIFKANNPSIAKAYINEFILLTSAGTN